MMAAVITLVAVIYTVEDWRGRRAWRDCRRELEAQGEALDWGAYIPAPAPEDQNIFNAPKMREWFVQDRRNEGARLQPGKAVSAWAFLPSQLRRPDTNLLVAEVTVVSSASGLNSPQAGFALRFDDPAAPSQAARFLAEAVAPCAVSPRGGNELFVLPLNQAAPARLILETSAMPSAKALAAFLAKGPLSNSATASFVVDHLSVAPSGSDSFGVSVKSLRLAADYLIWSEPITTNLDLIRQALKRPYARIDGDYERPFMNPILNYVAIRDVAQTLAERAQCRLVLGQPEEAWRELALIRELCRLLEPQPAGKSITLVAAMIDAAVSGLYTMIVQDGLRMRAWREPQLLAIQRQLRETDLLSPFVAAIRSDRAASDRTYEIMTPGEISMIYLQQSHLLHPGLEERIHALALDWMPRGWIYQDRAASARAQQKCLAMVDRTNQLVFPQSAEQLGSGIRPKLNPRSPYTSWAVHSLANCLKATQTLALKQTIVNEGQVACALERYRLAEGRYPETTDALVPRFLEKLPHDLMGGQALKYRRTEDGGFLLYSIGWDERDDGGVPGKTVTEGDWVWQSR